jgi:hypothetical protein
MECVLKALGEALSKVKRKKRPAELMRLARIVGDEKVVLLRGWKRPE